MPDERTKALLLAGELLARLASPVKSPDVPDAIRKQAQHILRHYPSRGDIGYLAEDAERGAFIAGPMLDAATAVHPGSRIPTLKLEEHLRKKPIERLADKAEPILVMADVAFVLAAVAVIVSLMWSSIRDIVARESLINWVIAARCSIATAAVLHNRKVACKDLF